MHLHLIRQDHHVVTGAHYSLLILWSLLGETLLEEAEVHVGGANTHGDRLMRRAKNMVWGTQNLRIKLVRRAKNLFRKKPGQGDSRQRITSAPQSPPLRSDLPLDSLLLCFEILPKNP